MFENVIGHSNITGQMRKEIASSLFPSSVMISGPLYSGKQTIALEAARALTCGEKGEWNCRCTSCTMHRLLANPSTILMGWDFFMPEISSTGKMLQRKPEPVSCFLFIRAVRKLTNRFTPVIIEDNDTKYKKISARLASIEEMLADFDPTASTGNSDVDQKKTETIVQLCSEIIKDYSYNGISVDQVRKAGYWLRFSGYGKKKIVIIENSENMNESARNSLLKLLEEPPENSFFFLLTKRPGEIIPTVKSRLRKYELKERSHSENRQVIEKIFREDGGVFSDLKEYLNSSVPEVEIIKKGARQFLTALFDSSEKTICIPSDLRPLFRGTYSGFFTDFLSELLKLSGELLGSSSFIDKSPQNLALLKNLGKLVNDAYRGYETLNINQELLAESLFLELRRTYEKLH